MRSDRRGEEGSATVTALGVVGVLLVLLLATLTLGAASGAAHRAQSAADLAALAGARPAGGAGAAGATGTAGAAGTVGASRASGGCAQARRIAELHGAVLRECHVDGADLEVEVAVTPAGPARRFGDAVARARAGPDRPGDAGVAPGIPEGARAPAEGLTGGGDARSGP
ncbi:flp pilus-assembly TadE/G-like family protein [Mobilicoccus pelagius]|uniref:Putative Flp pilus-assembly TadG-like N-terminal domain-containing protein n=1 Tax=Mobilicoccus pelagius NBRC 104925 TaxID=1089455 RepID=H5UNW8_9MICO|nr:flp pilus-assembly TadE/G-like family protein [Mobilicoccus pelagius]GAB47426.1 hypothetical protein MOPEL_011_00080 [Mobilicoccus pelagius NBRC 104925]